jgi:hypothetical protein
MVDHDTGKRYYRFVLGRMGTGLDSAFMMEQDFELAPQSR